MGSDAPRSVGAMGATSRTVITVTVTVRICLANSHSPIGADASRSVDSIGTSGCVARLGKHERAKGSHDGEERNAICGEPLCSIFHFRSLFDSRRERLFHCLLVIKQKWT